VDGATRLEAEPAKLYFSIGRCIYALGKHTGLGAAFPEIASCILFEIAPSFTGFNEPFRRSYRLEGDKLELNGTVANRPAHLSILRGRWGHRK
jgi:hypothetical protein